MLFCCKKLRLIAASGALGTARVSAFAALLLIACCSVGNRINTGAQNSMPQKMLWAWERTEDLGFIDPNEVGVAFLAQTIFLENERISPRRRRQDLSVPPNTYLIAVTRIETNKETARRPRFDVSMVTKTAYLIRNTLELPGVKGIQVDFDAVVSERTFYRALITELRKDIPPSASLTMTALASWCTGDAWFSDFPVDEAVPMAFQMGADSENIKTYLRNGNDWQEPLCRGSYGISLDDPLNFPLKAGRRTFYFKNSAWNAGDADSVK
ncbi:MAG: hypothetical protein AB7J13_08535 [Pyrinomonadaceae bacterium]